MRFRRRRRDEIDELKETIKNQDAFLNQARLEVNKRNGIITELRKELTEKEYKIKEKPDWKTYCKECGKKGIPMNLERHVTCEFCGTKFEYVPLKEIVSKLEKKIELLTDRVKALEDKTNK